MSRRRKKERYSLSKAKRGTRERSERWVGEERDSLWIVRGRRRKNKFPL